MIDFYRKEIDKIIDDTFQETVKSIKECGHHDLNRNYVFKVETLSRSVIIKFYYKKNKRIRELSSLNYYKKAKLHILAYGLLTDGTEWSLYNYIEGEMLQSTFPEMNLQSQKKIFLEIGKEMAMLHNAYVFDYFGDWFEMKQSPLKDYREFIIADTERLIENLKALDNYDAKVFDPVIDFTRDQYPYIRELKEGRLCHRDYDGRNIIVNMNQFGEYKLAAVLDFEKCVVFNEHFDIIGLYRKYFLKNPELIEPFFTGYTQIKEVDEQFNMEFKFNLFRLGIDLCSWSQNVSMAFYKESYAYLKDLISIKDDLDQLDYRPRRL